MAACSVYSEKPTTAGGFLFDVVENRGDSRDIFFSMETTAKQHILVQDPWNIQTFLIQKILLQMTPNYSFPVCLSWSDWGGHCLTYILVKWPFPIGIWPTKQQHLSAEQREDGLWPLWPDATSVSDCSNLDATRISDVNRTLMKPLRFEADPASGLTACLITHRADRTLWNRALLSLALMTRNTSMDRENVPSVWKEPLFLTMCPFICIKAFLYADCAFICCRLWNCLFSGMLWRF